jgi:hypothetical protein
MDSDLKAHEEAKRDRAYDPVLRWQHIQEAIRFAEATLPPEKRRNRPRWPIPLEPPPEGCVLRDNRGC